ncbi:MAG: S16 family serine protease, partial [Oscillospiraceae bacterium]
SMAAYREHKKVVIIPKENESDLNEIDQTVRDNIVFIPVESVSDVLDIALTDIRNKNVADELSKWCVVQPKLVKQNQPII